MKFVEIPVFESFNTISLYLEHKNNRFCKKCLGEYLFFVTEWSYVDIYITPYGEPVCNFRHKSGNKRLCTGVWTFSNLDRGFKLRCRSSTSILHLYRT